MGSMKFESWSVQLNNIQLLNNSREVKRLGLVFVQVGDFVSAEAEGNVSIYYNVLSEVRQCIISGAFNVIVEKGTGEKKDIHLSAHCVTEDGIDITSIIR